MTILIFRVLNAKELEEVRVAILDRNAEVLAFELGVKANLDELGIRSQLFKCPSKSELISEFKEKILRFGHKSFTKDDQSLIELTSYRKEFYPWFLIRNKLFLDLHGLYVEYRWAQMACDANQGDERLFIYSDFSELSSLFNADVRSRVSLSKPKASKKPFKYALVFLVRFVLGLFRSNQKGRHLFLNSSIVSHRIFSLDGTHLEDGDFYYGYLQDELKNTSDFSNLLMLKNYGAVALPKFNACIKPFENIRNYQFYESFLGLSIFNLFRILRILVYRNTLKTTISEAYKKSKGFDKKIIGHFFKSADLITVTSYRYDLSLAILKKLRPLSVGGDDELTFLKYPMIAAAKQLGVPSFGLQHGGISSSNLNYSFITEDVKYDPFTDVTMTWGEYVLDRLCKESSYPKEKVKVVGQVRTDVITSLLQQPKESILSDYKQGQTIVLFASQPIYHQPDIRRQLLIDVFTLQRNNPDIRVIIKPHPNEKKDVAFFESVAKEIGVNAEIRFDDLYGLLAVSDIVITYYSTAGAEALYFEKELIVLDYNGIDSANYIKDGVARCCTNYTDLEDTVNQIIRGSAKDISSIRGEYLNKRVFQIDGKSRFRVMHEIRALSKK